MRMTGALVGIGIMFTPPALGQTAPAAPVAAEKMVCKVKPKTGTRFASKTCRTAAQWERITEEQRRAASEMIDRPVVETRRDN